jgi:hypothetical protein
MTNNWRHSCQDQPHASAHAPGIALPREGYAPTASHANPVQDHPQSITYRLGNLKCLNTQYTVSLNDFLDSRFAKLRGCAVLPSDVWKVGHRAAADNMLPFNVRSCAPYSLADRAIRQVSRRDL